MLDNQDRLWYNIYVRSRGTMQDLFPDHEHWKLNILNKVF